MGCAREKKAPAGKKMKRSTNKRGARAVKGIKVGGKQARMRSKQGKKY